MVINEQFLSSLISLTTQHFTDVTHELIKKERRKPRNRFYSKKPLLPSQRGTSNPVFYPLGRNTGVDGHWWRSVVPPPRGLLRTRAERPRSRSAPSLAHTPAPARAWPGRSRVALLQLPPPPPRAGFPVPPGAGFPATACNSCRRSCSWYFASGVLRDQGYRVHVRLLLYDATWPRNSGICLLSWIKASLR